MNDWIKLQMMPDSKQKDDVDSLCRAFTERTLPKSEWTHQTHLRVGMWHVWKYGKAEALERMREGIRRLNEAHGVPNSDSRGYHETITCSFISLLDEFLSRLPDGTTIEESCTKLTSSVLMDKDFVLAFYSRDLLMSARARMEYVEPDLAPVRLLTLTGLGTADDFKRGCNDNGSRWWQE